ncbi:MAG: hypothetical protein ACKO15_08880, partial [Burkholderiales bacterium]
MFNTCGFFFEPEACTTSGCQQLLVVSAATARAAPPAVLPQHRRSSRKAMTLCDLIGWVIRHAAQQHFCGTP